MGYDLKRALENSQNSSNTEQATTENIHLNSEKEKQPNQAVDHSNPENIDPKLQNNTQPYQLIKELMGLLERNGIPTKWEQSFSCPCVGSSGYPKTDCSICHGTGRAYAQENYLQVAYQSDDRGLYQGQQGNYDTGLTTATPQFTENGIENGISVGDRLSIDGMTLSQKYLFDVTEKRIKNGIYLPYNVVKLDKVITINAQNDLEYLEEGKDYDFNKDNSKFTPYPRLNNLNISLIMTTTLRFYVTNITKETRYEQIKKKDYKNIYLVGKDNKLLTNYMERYDKSMEPGTIYVRAPKKLVVRREDVFLGNLDISSNEGKGKDLTHIESKANNNALDPMNILGD